MRIALLTLVLFSISTARLRAADDDLKVVVVDAGTHKTITATATASPPAKFQWLKDGVAIKGATNASLVFDSLSHADEGSYSAIAWNRAGSATSNAIVLLVNSPGENILPPFITVQPINRTAPATSDVAFYAAAAGDGTTLQWHKNGVPLPGATSETLNLPSVTSNDAALYTLVATNSAGSVTSDAANLSVTEMSLAPSASVSPVYFLANVLTSVTLTATVQGTPSPTVQWLKSGSPLAGATNETLTLGGLTVNDGAAYSVLVANSAGHIHSNAAIVEVSDYPVVPTQ